MNKVRTDMVGFFNIKEPGPTDLSWDDKNSADYLFHPTVDLSILKTFIKKVCPKCKGSGWKPTIMELSEEQCPTCNGTGKVNK